jgi:hypothetical protein
LLVLDGSAFPFIFRRVWIACNSLHVSRIINDILSMHC